MSLFTKPVYLLGPPMLLLISIPLAIFATMTTTLALVLLTIRVSVVYFELGVALIHAYLFPEPPKPPPKQSVPPSASSSPPRSRHRRESSSSQDTAVPATRIHKKSKSSASALGISDLTRDFEGVGGWRYYEGEEDEALWMGMNKRLELPVAMPRRHQRRHTGEERWSWSPETMRMSPVQSRSRTPTQQSIMLQGEGDEYFPLQMGIRPLSTASEPLNRSALHSRRTSVVDVSPEGMESRKMSCTGSSMGLSKNISQ